MSTVKSNIELLEPEHLQKAMTQGTLGKQPDLLSLQLEPENNSPNLSCRRIGELSERYFLITHPMSKGQLAPLRAGQLVKIKFFDGLTFVAYPSYVERIFYSPEPFALMEIRHESEIKKQAIRSNRRVLATFPVMIQYDDKKTHEAVMTDVSMGGGMLISNETLPETANEVVLNIDVPNRTGFYSISVKGELRRTSTNKIAEHEVHSLGVKFVSIDSYAELVLNNHINAQLLAQSENP